MVMVMAHHPTALRTKTIRYIPTELKDILYSYQYQQDYRYKRLLINAIKTIRNLKLNSKRRRHLVHSLEKAKCKTKTNTWI